MNQTKKIFFVCCIFCSSLIYSQEPDKREENSIDERKQKEKEKVYIPAADKQRTLLKDDSKKQAEIKFRYARELQGEGKLRRSFQEYQDLLLLYPDHERVFESLMNSAEILKELEEFERAKIFYRRAYEKEKNRERGQLAYLELGRLFAQTGNEKKAAEIFQFLIKDVPESRIARLARMELDSSSIISETVKEDTPLPEEKKETPTNVPEWNPDSMGEGLEWK